MEKIRFETTIEITRPIQEVFAFTADFEHVPQWKSQALEVKQLSDGPIGVGTIFREVDHFLGHRFEGTYQIAEYEPNKRFSFKGTSGREHWSGTYLFESVGSGTRLTLVAELETGRFLSLAEPVLASMARRATAAELGHLKDLLVHVNVRDPDAG